MIMIWKTQKRIRMLMEAWFRNDLMGICGDEDGGGMSAFLVFSAMGFYPVTAGMPSYTFGSPLFSKVTIKLDNGKTFVLEAKGADATHKYIQSVEINGSFAIRQGKWKLSFCPGSGGWSNPRPPSRRKKGAKVKPELLSEPLQLYDLSTDIAETENLAGRNPETVQRLTKLVQQYISNGRSTPGVKQENTGKTYLYPAWIRKLQAAKAE